MKNSDQVHPSEGLATIGLAAHVVPHALHCKVGKRQVVEQISGTGILRIVKISAGRISSLVTDQPNARLKPRL